MTTIHVIKSEKLQVMVNEKGAEVSSVRNTSGLEYMWNGRPDTWPRHAPVLFPIVGKLAGDTFTVDGCKYEMGQHGFARDMAFEMLEKDVDHITFRLVSDDFTLNKFPYAFVLDIKYTLSDNKLTVEYKVENPADEPLFFSIGGHPGFACPLEKTEKFEDYYLLFEKKAYELTNLQNGLRNGKRALKLENKMLPLSTELFDNDALVFEEGQINSIKLCTKHLGARITLECKDWPYFGIWTKKDCREFICLEPWYGITDNVLAKGEFTEKDGIHKLAAGAVFRKEYSITFS
jgi:galactose mutarotase-like enzyme